MQRYTLALITLALIALLTNFIAPASAAPDLSAMTTSQRSEYLRESSGGSIFIVNSTLDGGDTNPGNESCVASTGGCTLRAAIEEANDDNDHDIIQFDFSTPTIIAPTDGTFPTIENPLTVDGVEGNLSTCPTLSNPAELLVTLMGNASGNILTMSQRADDSVVKGLNIVGGETGILLYGVRSNRLSNVSIVCNHIGTDSTDSTAIGNERNGIYLSSGVSDSVIGGETASDRNVISGNGNQGIGNAHIPIDPGAGSNQTFVENLQVLGNYIGTARNGTTPLGNAAEGVSLTTGDEVVGSAAAPNIIAHNGLDGVNGASIVQYNVVHSNGATGVAKSSTIRGNNIYNNGQLGIDWGDEGVNPIAPNQDGNAPTLLTVSGNQLRFNFHVAYSTFKTYRFEVFHSGTCDDSGYGEGITYIEAFNVLPLSAFSTIDKTLSTPLPIDKFITITATDPSGLTSEFSNCIRENSVFTVDSRAAEDDQTPGDGDCATSFGECTLRAAIEEINAQLASGPFVIYFDIVRGFDQILLVSALPTIEKTVHINATTYTGTLCDLDNAAPDELLILNGINLSTGNGLVFGGGSDGSSVQGLTIKNFPTDGIQSSSNNNRFFCNILESNGDDGIQITGNGNVVGGTEAFRRNVIMDNGESGVEIAGAGQFNNVLGNYIGTDGVSAEGNAIGVRVAGFGIGNNIGAQGFLAIENEIEVRGYNVIAGNTSHGVHLTTTGVNTNVGGNLIGVQPDGVTPLGNSGAGILAESPMARIGLTRGQFGQLYEVPNVIGASGAAGIGVFADDAWVTGNFIGVPMTGTAAIGNTGNGIYVTGDDARIHDNVIGGNGGHGVRVSGGSNEFYGNVIGLAADGSTARGNSLFGMSVQGDFNVIGDADDEATWNTIVHSGGYGIFLDKNVNFTQIAGSTIRDNGDDGIAVDPLSSNNYFVKNAIYDNTGMAIDINNDDGVIANDEQDVDTGSNTLINRIEIVSADSDSSEIHIRYNGTPNHLHFLEFYTNPTCRGSGAGQGQTPIKTNITFTTDGAGDWEENYNISDFVSGDGITALVTNNFSGGAPNSTSEFSDCVVATGAAPTAVVVSKQLTAISQQFRLWSIVGGLLPLLFATAYLRRRRA